MLQMAAPRGASHLGVGKEPLEQFLDDAVEMRLFEMEFACHSLPYEFT